MICSHTNEFDSFAQPQCCSTEQRNMAHQTSAAAKFTNGPNKMIFCQLTICVFFADPAMNIKNKNRHLVHYPRIESFTFLTERQNE
jgi:hypothetical protein